jgi:pyrroline-5-carboxylate reductase
MARALAQGFVRQQRVAATDILASDCSETSRRTFQQALPEARVTADNTQVARECELIVLAVKPPSIGPICEQLRPLPNDRLVVSIAAGIPLAQLSSGLSSERIVRVMPNTPCLVGQGAAAYCRGAGVREEDLRLVAHLLQAVGRCIELPESLLDAVTGLSGSGPAFVFLFIEALSDGGVRMGLPREVAQELAAQTVLGAAAMVLNSQEHPAVLKDRVASPAGTTIAGLHALEAGAMRAAVISAVVAATERSRELGRS